MALSLIFRIMQSNFPIRSKSNSEKETSSQLNQEILIMYLFTVIKETYDEHPILTTLMAGGIVAGVSYISAPTIAATLGAKGFLGVTASGTVISTLKGAALVKASLAAIGGGAVSAGGAGVVGGTAVITVTGGAVGGGATVATRKLMQD